MVYLCGWSGIEYYNMKWLLTGKEKFGEEKYQYISMGWLILLKARRKKKRKSWEIHVWLGAPHFLFWVGRVFFFFLPTKNVLFFFPSIWMIISVSIYFLNSHSLQLVGFPADPDYIVELVLLHNKCKQKHHQFLFWGDIIPMHRSFYVWHACSVYSFPMTYFISSLPYHSRNWWSIILSAKSRPTRMGITLSITTQAILFICFIVQ